MNAVLKIPKLKITFSVEELMTLFFWGYLGFFQRLTKMVEVLFGIKYEILDLILWGIVIAVSYNHIIRSIHFSTVVYTIIVLLFIIFSFSIWTENIILHENLWKAVLNFFPFFYIGNVSVIRKSTLDKMVTISKIALITNIAVYAIYYTRYFTSGELNDMLGIAYMMLPHILLICFDYTDDRSISKLIWAAVAVVYLFGLGARGPIFVGFLMFITVYLMKNNKLKIIVAGAFLFLLSIVLWYNGIFKVILDHLYHLFSNLGISTRILRYFSGGIIYLFDSSERFDIWSLVINETKKHPLIGNGPYWYIRLGNIEYYAHNLMLDMLMHFGFVIGIVICVLIIIQYIKAFKYSLPYEKTVLIIMLFAVFGKLMISATYIEDTYFFFALGYLFTFNKVTYRSKVETAEQKVGEKNGNNKA